MSQGMLDKSSVREEEDTRHRSMNCAIVRSSNPSLRSTVVEWLTFLAWDQFIIFQMRYENLRDQIKTFTQDVFGKPKQRLRHHVCTIREAKIVRLSIRMLSFKQEMSVFSPTSTPLSNDSSSVSWMHGHQHLQKIYRNLRSIIRSKKTSRNYRKESSPIISRCWMHTIEWRTSIGRRSKRYRFTTTLPSITSMPFLKNTTTRRELYVSTGRQSLNSRTQSRFFTKFNSPYLTNVAHVRKHTFFQEFSICIEIGFISIHIIRNTFRRELLYSVTMFYCISLLYSHMHVFHVLCPKTKILAPLCNSTL